MEDQQRLLLSVSEPLDSGAVQRDGLAQVGADGAWASVGVEGIGSIVAISASDDRNEAAMLESYVDDEPALHTLILEPAQIAAESIRAEEQLLDLTRQQRNLLLMRPVFELEFNKNSFTGAGGSRNLMRDIDTHYLVLCLLDFLMESVAITNGCYAKDAVEHLAKITRSMSNNLVDDDCTKIADHVFAYMANRRDNYKGFTYEYFDSQAKSISSHGFKLIRFEPDSVDNYLYKPTEEGYLVYLGMLDLAPEDSAELMEKMLHLLIKRNKWIIDQTLTRHEYSFESYVLI